MKTAGAKADIKRNLLYIMKEVALAQIPDEEKNEIYHLILYGQRSAEEIKEIIRKYLIARIKRNA